MAQYLDISAQRFGRLVVVEYAGKNKQGAAMWRCKCDCGNEKVVCGAELRRGKTFSCGCLHSEVQKKLLTKYGFSNSRIAQIWRGMMNRCNSPRSKSYELYGGRGINVCDEWAANVENFREWALESGYTEDLTIDRIDPNGNYEPGNCRWVDMKTQQNNRRNNVLLTYDGLTRTITEWSEITGIDYTVIKARVRKGWPIERALTEKVKGR